MAQTSSKSPQLPIGARKFLGMLILMVGLVVYAIAAVWLVTSALPDHWAVHLVFYPVAGIAWAFPARYLIAWMQRPDEPTS
ncbi:MAG: DUF2842 domain-containing protein [Rhodobiaceae bacterium]|nr:DUF2842 domain-containing protein [Rhodobiaceae bacterium]